MNIQEELSQVRPPTLIGALLAGFDSITHHLPLLVFPVLLDILLWLGPKLHLETLIRNTLSAVARMPGMDTPDAIILLRISQEFWSNAAERLNLFTALRSFPVGLPSLMASELPSASPFSFNVWEVPNWQFAILLWLILSLIGILFGSFYFLATAHAATQGTIDWHSVIAGWPQASLHTLLVTVLWILGLLVFSLPAGLLFSFVLSSNSLFGQLLMLVIGGFFVWLLFSLVFSVHGIYVYKMPALASLRKSVRLTQVTFVTTTIFFIALLVFDQGLGLIWRTPADQSWFNIVGIVGHAFISTGLLAASFIYYRDADQWIQSIFNRFSRSQNA